MIWRPLDAFCFIMTQDELLTSWRLINVGPGELSILCNLLDNDESVRYGPARRCVHTDQ